MKPEELKKLPKRKRAPRGMTHRELIDVVHRLTDIPKYKVREVLNAVPKAIFQQLQTGTAVTFMGLGQFRVIKRRVNGKPHIRIAMRGAVKLKRALGREHTRKKGTMEKYGVDLDKGKEVNARITGKCPDCGAELPAFGDTGSSQPNCSNCGTKPFETAGVTSGRVSAKHPNKSNPPRSDK